MKHVFSERLTNLRIQQGFSQKELAHTLNTTPANLSNYENGIYLPPLEKACTLATTLHTSLDYMTGLSDKDIDPVLLSRSVTEKLSFYHIIKLLASLDNKELLEIMKYIEFLKYKRKRSTYIDEPKALLVAEDAENNPKTKE